MMWGRKKENGAWMAPSPAYKVWVSRDGRDALYIAAWRFRLRVTWAWLQGKEHND
jgi:hypothetical protein